MTCYFFLRWNWCRRVRNMAIRTDCVIHFCDEQGTWHEMTHAGMAMELMQNTEETRKLLRELSKAGITFYLKG